MKKILLLDNYHFAMLQLSEQDEQNSTMVHMKAELSEAISGKVLSF